MKHNLFSQNKLQQIDMFVIASIWVGVTKLGSFSTTKNGAVKKFLTLSKAWVDEMGLGNASLNF